jgi:hypothetical protein
LFRHLLLQIGGANIENTARDLVLIVTTARGDPAGCCRSLQLIGLWAIPALRNCQFLAAG